MIDEIKKIVYSNDFQSSFEKFETDLNNINRSPENIKEIEQLETSKKIIKYLNSASLGFQFKIIDEITNNKSPYLLPYLQRFLSLDLKPGLYVTDGIDFYLPIDLGLYGICHFIRNDFKKENPIYAISELKYTRALFLQKYILLFIGVVETRVGFNFIYNDYRCIPIPAIEPAQKVSYVYAHDDDYFFKNIEEKIDEEDEETEIPLDQYNKFNIFSD